MLFSDLIGRLDSDARIPLYRQLQQKLRSAIEKNTFNPDEPLPAERDLAEEFSISRITVRKALEGLVEEGLLTRRRGAGTFVARRVEKSFSQLTSFSEEMTARGLEPSSTWISRTQGTVTSEEVMNYGLSPGMEVYRLNRVRYAGGAPMAIEYAVIPAHCLPSAEAMGESLYDALNKSGYKPVRALQRLRAVLLEEEEAALLNANVNDPGLLVERRGFLEDGRIVEVSRSFYRGDTYDFVAELHAG